MKILFSGPLSDFSGFAGASRHFARVIDQGPHELVCRALRYDQRDVGQSFSPEPWLSRALAKPLDNIAMSIQMTTSNIEAVPIPGVLNGLFTFLESDRMQHSWAAKANEFDFLIVASKANAEAMLRSGVTKPILVCAVPCNSDVYSGQHKPYEIENAGQRTIFYNICQLSYKKGIDALLRAYYAAFADLPDDVLLVLKTYINMGDRKNDLEQVKQYVAGIRQRCRIPATKFPPVLPLVFTMTDEEICGLHTRGDVYVCSSRAEGWNMPLFDAMGFGKVIVSNTAGGMGDFVIKDNALVYGGTPTFFFDSPHSDPGLFTGVEQCFEPCIPEMALLMRKYYLLKKADRDGTLTAESRQEWDAIKDRQVNARLLGEKFDYRRVAPIINNQLTKIYTIWKETGSVSFTPQEQDGRQTVS